MESCKGVDIKFDFEEIFGKEAVQAAIQAFFDRHFGFYDAYERSRMEKRFVPKMKEFIAGMLEIFRESDGKYSYYEDFLYDEPDAKRLMYNLRAYFCHYYLHNGPYLEQSLRGIVRSMAHFIYGGRHGHVE